MREYKADELIRPEESITFQEIVVDGEEAVHTHDFIEIVYIASGRGRQTVGGVSCDVQRGDAVFINFGQTHSFRSRGQMRYINCILLPEFMGRELISSENALDILALAGFEEFSGQISSTTPKVSFAGADMLEVEDILGRMLAEFREKQVGYRSVLKGYVTVFLAKIFRGMRGGDTSGIMRHVSRISPDIIKYIEDNCFEKITLRELAEKSFYNPAYFSRIFRECCGMSLTDFIHEKRIGEAVKLLQGTVLSVEEICRRVGYREKKQFYKIFRQYTGTTPGEYRLHVEKQTTIPSKQATEKNSAP